MVASNIRKITLFKIINWVGVCLSVRAFLKSLIILLKDIALDVALDTDELATDIWSKLNLWLSWL